MICIAETHFHEKEKEIPFKGYKGDVNNRSNDSGGLLIAWREELHGMIKVVHTYKDVGQCIWITLINQKVEARIGLVYAPQESRTSKKDLMKMYSDIQDQIAKAVEYNQQVIILGDFNGKVGNVIPGNSDTVTKGGRLIMQMVKKNNLTIGNALRACEGLWTREEKKKEIVEKSVIDYVFLSKEAAEALTSMLIDDKKEYPVYSIDSEDRIYSDHNTVLLSINWMFKFQRNSQGSTRITKEGYSRYRQSLREKRISKLIDHPDLQIGYDQWSAEVEQAIKEVSQKVQCKTKKSRNRKWIKHKRYIRQRIRNASQENRIILKNRLKLIDQHILNESKARHRKKIDKIVQSLRANGGVHGPNFWEVRRRILGKKEEAPAAVKDRDGSKLETTDKILERYKNYYQDLLTTNPAQDIEEKAIEETVNKNFERIIKEGEKEISPPISIREVKRAIKKLKRRKAADRQNWKNEWILEGGQEMVVSLWKLFNKIQESKKIPLQWNHITIKSIHKKGAKDDLDNKRGIFLVNVIYKTFERVLLERNKVKLENSMSQFQCGGRSGMSTSDNIMAISAIIERNKILQRNTYLFFADAVKCFDRLWLQDCLVQLHQGGVTSSDIQLLYVLNQKASIKVNTPVGETEEFSVQDTVKQGTISGPVLCCAEVDKANQVKANAVESPYGPSLIIAMPAYVDDVSSAGDSTSAKNAIKICRSMEYRKFNYGLKKTGYLVIESGNEGVEEISENLKEGTVPQIESHEHLGLWINKKGNLDLHITEMDKKIKGAIYETIKVANENEFGGEVIRARLKLYEASIVKAMLHGLESWGGLKESEIQRFEMIQCKCLKILLRLPTSTSNIGILLETGCWPIQERIEYSQLMLFHNVINSNKSRLASSVIQQQITHNMPNTITSKVRNISAQLQLDCTVETLKNTKKSSFKKLIKKKLTEKIQRRLSEESTSHSKLRFIDKDKFGRKAYLEKCHSSIAYQILKIRLNMENVKCNFKGQHINLLCDICKRKEETTEHALLCTYIEGNPVHPDGLKDPDNQGNWTKICLRMRRFMKAKEEIAGDQDIDFQISR